MITEDSEARLQAIVEFIEKHKTQERRIQLQTFYGEFSPATLVSWNDTGFTTPWFFTPQQVEATFLESLRALGEAVGYCKRIEAYSKSFCPTMGNFKGDVRFMEGSITAIPNPGDMWSGSCVVVKDIFKKHDLIEVSVKINLPTNNHDQSIRFSATSDDLAPLLADLLYPIVTVGLGGSITYEFIEAFIGWLHSENN